MKNKKTKKEQLLKLECINCGASLKMLDKTHARCAHCNQNYLIDQIEDEIIDINVDYGNNKELKRAISTSKVLLIVFVSLVSIILLITLAYNIAARTSYFSSADYNLPVRNRGNLLVTFCEDIFGKDYSQITEEELATIKYIRCSYERDENDQTYNVVDYSFTDYQDCESEEAFQKTIQHWTYRTEMVSWPDSFSMFKGLTRINTNDAIGLNSIQLYNKNVISYVEADDSLKVIATALNPENIKVLHVGILGTTLDEIGQFTNLEELVMDSNLNKAGSGEVIDIRQLAVCKKLRKLELDCANGYTGKESLTELTQLESLYLSCTPLSECSFLKNLPQLKELYLYSGEEPDLSILSYLPNLKKLCFMDYDDIDAEPLGALTNLEELEAHLDSMESLNKLTALKNLQKINVSVSIDYFPMEEQQYDLSVLAQLPNLSDVSIEFEGGGRYIGIESILNMPKMERVSIEYDWRLGIFYLIINEELLQENPNIRMLKLGGYNCELVGVDTQESSDYNFIRNYKNIRELYLNECSLTNIDFVSELQELEICSLIGNEIDDYSKLLDCHKLKQLYVKSGKEINVTFPPDVEVLEEPSYLLLNTTSERN